MMERQTGSIVNIAHVFSFERGAPMFAHSGAARAGVVNLTRSLAPYAEQRNVTINALAPGTTISPEAAANYGMTVEEWRAQPSRARYADPEDMAAIVLFMCSPAARMLNGAVIVADAASTQFNWPARSTEDLFDEVQASLRLIRPARARGRWPRRSPPVLLGVVGEHDEVVHLAGEVADVVEQQRLDLEADRLEHRDRGPLLGDDLHDELRVAGLEAAHEAFARELLAEPAAARGGVDDEADARHVVRPADAAEEREPAHDAAVVVDQDQPLIALARCQEALDHVGVEDVLVEERPVALGHAHEELGDELEIVRLDGSQLHR